MKKKILIMYASYGSGHKAIANYIKEYINKNNDDIEVATLDILTNSMSGVGSISQKVNSFFMLKTPWIHNLFYDITSTKIGGDVIDSISMTIFKNKKMENSIKKYNPDIVIATHFFGASLTKYYNDKGITNAKIITVVTDYDIVELWIKYHESIDSIVVASKTMERDLIKRGVSKDKIKVFGIPVAPNTDHKFNRKAALKKYNLKGNNPICVFFGGGGNGNSKTIPYIKRLVRHNKDIDFIFVAGKNELSKNIMEEYMIRHNLNNIRVLGFSDKIPELLELSDFVISKPGGIQLTECLYFNKPVFMITNSGGQEIANYKYFEHKGYGKYFKTSWGLNKYISNLSNNKKILEKIRTNMQNDPREDAIGALYNLICEYLKD